MHHAHKLATTRHALAKTDCPQGLALEQALPAILQIPITYHFPLLTALGPMCLLFLN